MDSLNSIIFTKESPVNVSIVKLDNIVNQWNDYMEILFILKGSLTFKNESDISELREDDIVVINPNEAYAINNSSAFAVSIKIDPAFYSDMVQQPMFISCNSSIVNNKQAFFDIKKKIARLVNVFMSSETPSALGTVSYACSLLNELDTKYRNNPRLVKSSGAKALNHLKRITDFMHQNYADNITLQTISDREFLSPTYISHMFEKNLGLSFYSYLTRIRLLHAVRDLLTTDMTNEQIAQNHGFSNYRYFVSSFKKQYKMLPKEYRRAYHQPESTSNSASAYANLVFDKYDLMNKLGEYLAPSDNEESRTSSKLYISNASTIEIKCTSTHKTFQHKYKVFTSVGKAHEILYASVQEEILEIQREIGFSYIKFHGILDDPMHLYNEDSSGEPQLVFSYVDEVLDFLLRAGLKPLIEFSFMPKLLAKETDRTMFHVPSIISAPSSNKKWYFLIRELTKHLIERYSLAEVRSWMFTFWNMPFNNQTFAFENNETLYQLYRLTYEAVKECDHELSFGFPSTILFESQMTVYSGLLEFAEENHCYPDFYILHCYPIKSSTNPPIYGPQFSDCSVDEIILLSDDPDYMSKYLSQCRKYLYSHRKLPIYITEWNSTLSHRDWLNDTCYQSAYIVKNILENHDGADSFSHWCLSDTLEELPASDEEFHGELGLFTIHKIKKPAYYAFTLLNRLYSNIVSCGQSYFLTKNGTGDYALMLYNFIPVSSMYADGLLFNVNPLERYNAFSKPGILPVDIRLTSISNGNYQVTEQFINREHGSAFDTWVNMGAFPLRTPADIEILKRGSQPGSNIFSIDISDTTYRYQAELQAHEIRLVIFRRVYTEGE